MGSRAEGVTTCVTWSSVPPVVPALIHLSAAIETAKGTPPTGAELLGALKTLHEIRPLGDATAEEYKGIAASYTHGDPECREQTLPRDIICRILEGLLSQPEPVVLLAGHKAGIPLRAWIPTELADRVRQFCKRRCSKSAFFITAATAYFDRIGVNITTL